MDPLCIRPENRRREEPAAAAWIDTAPAVFRSEGFAEDLPQVPVLSTDRSRPGHRRPLEWRVLKIISSQRN